MIACASFLSVLDQSMWTQSQTRKVTIVPGLMCRKAKSVEYNVSIFVSPVLVLFKMNFCPAVLKSRDEVDVYLKSFGSILTVVDIKENDHAKPDGALYKKFVAARDSLPVSDRKTCLAFHGTADTNIDSICKNGYDPLRRCGQARGPGEYFATTPSTPLGYVQGGKRILLNELLLGQNGVHHTQHGDIVVMKYPEHDLPRFVITFK